MNLIPEKPRVGVVCGSGLGTLREVLQNRIDLSYEFNYSIIHSKECQEVLFADRSNCNYSFLC